jgi:hypothetical protein
VIHPSDLEEAARKAGFAIGNGVKGLPVNRFEESRGPTMQSLKVLGLSLSWWSRIFVEVG